MMHVGGASVWRVAPQGVKTEKPRGTPPNSQPTHHHHTELAALGPAWATAVSAWTCASPSQCDPCGAGTNFWGAWPHIDCRTPGASANEKAGGGRVTNIHFTQSANGDLGAAVNALCGLSQAKEFDVTTADGAAPIDGEIPEAIVTCFPHTHKFKSNYGRLTGALPAWLADGKALPALSYLNIDSNALTGPIPAEWGGNPSLFWVDVGQNPLGGSIPSTFANHPSLGVFRAANANLTGNVLGLQGAPLQVVDLKKTPASAARCPSRCAGPAALTRRARGWASRARGGRRPRE